MIEEYAEERGIYPRLKNSNGTTRMMILHADDIESFLEPLRGGFIQQRDRIDYFLENIIPALEDGQPESKEKFIEVMKMKGKVEKYPITGRQSKYDVEFFTEKRGEIS